MNSGDRDLDRSNAPGLSFMTTLATVIGFPGVQFENAMFGSQVTSTDDRLFHSIGAKPYAIWVSSLALSKHVL